MTKKQKEGIDLPNLPNKKTNHDAIEYINLIYSGVEKYEAFKQIFPERFQRVHDRAVEQKRNPKFAVLNDIGAYEAGKYVQELYKINAERYFSHFIDKRTKILNKMADKALDDDLDVKDQMTAAKIFLGHVPEVKKEEKVVIEHKLAEDTKFIAQLQAKKELLYRTASNEDIIEAEIEELK